MTSHISTIYNLKTKNMKNDYPVSNKDILFSRMMRVMKLVTVLLLSACLQLSASGWSQDRITLKVNDAEIKKVLLAIEKQSDYRFLFSEDAIKGKPKVTFHVVQATVKEVLDKLF